MSAPNRPELVQVKMDSNYTTSELADINYSNVKRFIEMHEHPHPLVMLVLAVILVSLIWLIYRYMIRLNLSGQWVIEPCVEFKDKPVIVLDHKWSGSVNVVNGPISANGYADGMGIYMDIYNQKGAPGRFDLKYALKGIIYDGAIFWMNGCVWRKIKL